jgi:hypothetical protein
VYAKPSPLRGLLSPLDQSLDDPYGHPPPSPLPYHRAKQLVQQLPPHVPHVASLDPTWVGAYMMLDAQSLDPDHSDEHHPHYRVPQNHRLDKKECLVRVELLV